MNGSTFGHKQESSPTGRGLARGVQSHVQQSYTCLKLFLVKHGLKLSPS